MPLKLTFKVQGFLIGLGISQSIDRYRYCFKYIYDRYAVMTLPRDDEWCQWSNLKIAQYCKVSESLVRTIKKNLGIRSDKIVFEDSQGGVREMKKGRLETNGNSTHECFV